CDGGYGGPGGFVPAETCASLGQGDGTLACGPYCTWDTTGCEASQCVEYGANKVKMRRLASPSGDDSLDFRASDLVSTGLSFDPSTEAVSLVVRDQTGLVYAGTIPAGAPGWTGGGDALTYVDQGGANNGIVKVEINGTPSLGTGFRTVVRV